MRISHFDDIPFKERLPRHRDGRFDFKSLMTGSPKSLGNFNLEAVRTYGDFFSPRHRHNFDQYRLQLEGRFDFDRNGKMAPGMVAYFPEGTPYGPQSSSEDSLTIVLQFGGASRSGYLSREEFLAGSAELQEKGNFMKGAFTETDEGGRKRNQDGFEAVWEYVNKKKLEYPAPRYLDPVFINPDNFSWIPSEEENGVARKHLGSFGERGTSVSLIRIEPGAHLAVPERSICFVLTGQGAAAEIRWKSRSTVHVDEGEVLRITAETPTKLVHFGLPTFRSSQVAAPI